MRLIILSIALGIFVFHSGKSQICPVHYSNQDFFDSKIGKSLSNKYSNTVNFECSSPIIIPVAVHFGGNIHSYGNSLDSICIVRTIERQIERLNMDFGGYNSDIGNYCNLIELGCGFDPNALATTTCIQFVISNINHPNVTITNSPNSRFLVDGDYAVTFGKHEVTSFNCDSGGMNCLDPLFNIINTEWDGYLNLYVSDIVPLNGPSGVYGAANLDSGTSANGSGVWINANSFGGDGISCLFGPVLINNRNTLGRTATHELGHHFGLPHIFNSIDKSDPNVNCSSDNDGINDTPIQKYANSSNVDFFATECGQHSSRMDICDGEHYFNYMDYVRDDQMYMFTQGQALRINEIIEESNSVDNISYLSSSLVSTFVPDFSPTFMDGCPEPIDYSSAPCMNVFYTDYFYLCGGNKISVTTGAQSNFNGRNCGSEVVNTNNGNTAGGGPGGGGSGGGSGGPGGPGSSGTTNVNPGSSVPVISENDECNECIKETQKKVETELNNQNNGN